MVVPFSSLEMPPGSMEAPQVVKERHAVFWWFAVALMNILWTVRFATFDVFGASNTGMLAFLAYYLVRDGCQNMSQCCVLYFGLLCFTNGLFDVLPLLASMGGRTTETTEYKPSEAGTKVYTVTIEKYPFFDTAKGSFYNFQSVVMICSPIVMFIGALVASKTYGAYETSLFADSEDEARNSGAPGGSSGWPPSGRLHRGGSFGSDMHQATQSSIFEGRAHRLGDT